jgi:hypothetical protein
MANNFTDEQLQEAQNKLKNFFKKEIGVIEKKVSLTFDQINQGADIETKTNKVLFNAEKKNKVDTDSRGNVKMNIVFDEPKASNVSEVTTQYDRYRLANAMAKQSCKIEELGGKNKGSYIKFAADSLKEGVRVYSVQADGLAPIESGTFITESGKTFVIKNSVVSGLHRTAFSKEEVSLSKEANENSIYGPAWQKAQIEVKKQQLRFNEKMDRVSKILDTL